MKKILLLGLMFLLVVSSLTGCKKKKKLEIIEQKDEMIVETTEKKRSLADRLKDEGVSQEEVGVKGELDGKEFNEDENVKETPAVKRIEREGIKEKKMPETRKVEEIPKRPNKKAVVVDKEMSEEELHKKIGKDIKDNDNDFEIVKDKNGNITIK